MIRKFFTSCLIIFLALTSKQNVFAQTTAVNNPESPHALTLEVDKNQTIANGQDTTTITATLKDRTTFEPLENSPQEHPPVVNTPLNLQVSGGGTNFSWQQKSTDSNGQVKVFLTATVPGEKTVTVTDPSLSSTTYPTDYYKVSLTVTFLPVGTPTPIPSPTPTPTPAPTSTPTPWQPSGPLKIDPGFSYFSVEPSIVSVGQTATIRITLRDNLGNFVVDEVPHVVATGKGNTIIQPTAEVNSLAYFSSVRITGERKITVYVGDVQIGKDIPIQVNINPFVGLRNQNLDISLDAPPEDKLKLDTHKDTPIYFHVPKSRHVEKITAVLLCGENQLNIPLVLQNTNGQQIFVGYIPKDDARGRYAKCILQTIMQPPEEPDEPPIEIPIEPIDPFGVVYDAKTGEALAGAVVTLYELQDSKWVVWNGLALQQVNPQITDESGLYSFFVYPGKYYLTVKKEGYNSFQSETIEVIKEAVKLDVYLNPKPEVKLWLWMTALLIPVGFVVIALFIWQRKRKGIKPSETQPVELQANAH